MLHCIINTFKLCWKWHIIRWIATDNEKHSGEIPVFQVDQYHHSKQDVGGKNKGHEMNETQYSSDIKTKDENENGSKPIKLFHKHSRKTGSKK